MGACKTTQTTQAVSTASAYSEDLSVHRPAYDESAQILSTSETVIPDGHIKAELDSITKILVSRNKKPRSEQGFTIQLYNGPNKSEATKTLGMVRLEFPDLKSELTYYQPDFRVKAGQFVDRVIAYETYKKVKAEFSEAILIPENIKINHD